MICLEYILELYHMSQAELAETLGIKPQNLTLWLKGKQDVSKKHLPTMEKIFGIPQEYFQKELTILRAIEIQYLQKFGKPLKQINDRLDEDLNTLELVVSNYFKGVIMTPTVSFMFHTITNDNGKLVFQKEFSFDKVTINGNDISGINYPDELFEENCDIEIVLKNNETIKVLLFEKKMEAFMGHDDEECIVEPEQFIDALSYFKSIDLRLESDNVYITYVCTKWEVEDMDDSLIINFFPDEFDKKILFSLIFNETQDNIRIFELAPGYYRLTMYDEPFTTLDIQATC